MEIEKIRRLWHLSMVPSHSRESLKELHELVREAVAESIAHTFPEPVCSLCVNFNHCLENQLACMCLITTPKYKNFELRMEDA